jgi:hypothetical protein
MQWDREDNGRMDLPVKDADDRRLTLSVRLPICLHRLLFPRKGCVGLPNEKGEEGEKEGAADAD